MKCCKGILIFKSLIIVFKILSFDTIFGFSCGSDKCGWCINEASPKLNSVMHCEVWERWEIGIYINFQQKICAL